MNDHIELPEKLNVTITEEDRQQAGRFCLSEFCLLATAARRMGFAEPNMGTARLHVTVGDGRRAPYRALSGEYGIEEVCAYDRDQPPYYAPEVVGRTFEFELYQITD